MAMKQIKLISLSGDEYDDIGQPICEETYSELMADVRLGQTQAEYAAGKKGLRPEGRCVVWEDEYHGEELVEFKGKRYVVYRTYPDKGRMELYIGTRVGEDINQ